VKHEAGERGQRVAEGDIGLAGGVGAAGVLVDVDADAGAADRERDGRAAADRHRAVPDGADEIDPRGHMIKGGGAALTREKIVADLAERFVCIADESKRVDVLGRFPLPVEVIPMAAAQVARRFAAAYGGVARVRDGVRTDNGQLILDVHGLRITDPLAMETEVNQWPGVVTVGIFARHRASMCLLGTPLGVVTLRY